MERRIDRQQVGDEVAARIPQVVNPLHANRPVPLRFDRQRGCVVHQEASLALGRHGTVSPDGRRGQSLRQNLLGELLHRDLVVVRVLSARERDPSRARHHRRNQHGRSELSHRRWIQSVGNLGEQLSRDTKPVGEEQRERRGATETYKVSSCEHGLVRHLDATRAGGSMRSLTQLWDHER